jgi:hypothetical protein
MYSFKATIDIIGINPFVFVPEKILQAIFKDAGKEKGHIPIHGSINGEPYKQTLVKYSGHWRLYINTTMLKDSPKRIGEKIKVTVAFDARDRSIAMHAKLVKALKANKPAQKVLEQLPPSRQKEIIRYIASLKTEASVDRNVQRAIDFLLGNGSFVGRDKP